MNIKDIYWLAGLLEGEGCFHFSKKGNNPSISIGMTDEDVVLTAMAILGGDYHKQTNKWRTYKFYYQGAINGNRAIAWMFTLYPLLKERRRAKIREIISEWKLKHKGTGYSGLERTHCKNGHELNGSNVYKYQGHRKCKTCRANNYLRKKVA